MKPTKQYKTWQNFANTKKYTQMFENTTTRQNLTELNTTLHNLTQLYKTQQLNTILDIWTNFNVVPSCAKLCQVDNMARQLALESTAGASLYSKCTYFGCHCGRSNRPKVNATGNVVVDAVDGLPRKAFPLKACLWRRASASVPLKFVYVKVCYILF